MQIIALYVQVVVERMEPTPGQEPSQITVTGKIIPGCCVPRRHGAQSDNGHGPGDGGDAVVQEACES